jgi:hypothetical protein
MLWPWLIAVASVGLLGVGFCLWWWVPKWQMRSVRVPDPKDRADIEDNFRKTVGQALGGLLVLIAAGLAYYGTLQALQANEREARKLLISKQVAKGFEAFASKELRVRLGGIYELQGVMDTPEYQQPVLDALSTFVRESTKGGTDAQPPADVQLALTVIGRYPLPQPNLTNARIARADLRGANLRAADLGGACLYQAILAGADLSGSSLRGTNLSNANLTSVTVSQRELDQACGTNVTLPPGLTIKPCPPDPTCPPSAK